MSTMRWDPTDDGDAYDLQGDQLAEAFAAALVASDPDPDAAYAAYLLQHHDCQGLPHCAACGCCELHACEGGCIWATPTLCSRCAQ